MTVVITSADWTALRNALSSPERLHISGDVYERAWGDATTWTGQPQAVVVAASSADVINAIRFARQHDLAVVPRGAGTGLSGGAVPSERSLVVDLSDLQNISIDPTHRRAVCGAGAITHDIQRAAAAAGLAYPPDPASHTESTIGGNVAENAGGLACTRFGVTSDYVLGIRGVTADGSLLETGCYVGDRGFNFTDVIVGSEGTLAAITEVSLRLIPTTPSGTTVLISFPTAAAAGQAVAAIKRQGDNPTVLEFVDRDAAAISSSLGNVDMPATTGGLLLIETNASQAGQIERIHEVAVSHAAEWIRIASDPAEVSQLWAVRRELSRAIKTTCATYLSEDVALPLSRFAEAVDVVAAMPKIPPVRVVSFGHAGDGNLHAVFLADNTEAQTLLEMERLVEQLLRETIRLGGTLSGEHGIGIAKRQYLSWEFDTTTLQAMRSVKSTFDPDDRLNPDKIFL